jgi:Tol biopolymer transport system component
MKPDGTGVKQLTFNETDDGDPTLSPDGTKVAYGSEGIQTSNPEGDLEVYRLSVLDGMGKKNLTNNGLYVDDCQPLFSPDATKISFTSNGTQDSTLEGDPEVYVMNTLDGLGKKNLTNNDLKVRDSAPDFSRDGTKITYISYGIQTTNQEGDHEIYRMNALDGSGQTNLSNNAAVDGAFVKVIRG